MKLTVADFFCGAGGFSEGFRQKGFDVVFGLDNWKPAVETHELNHPSCKTVLMDILEIKTPEDIDAVVPDVDVIVGSPPCVSFSFSNKSGKADKTLGVKLIETYLKIILWKKSKKNSCLKYWILENVPNSKDYIKNKYTWKELDLPGNGPDLIIKNREVLNAANYGAPQTRKRFVCGDYPVPEIKVSQDKWITMEKVFEALKNPQIKEYKNLNIVDPNYNFTIKGKELTDHFYDSRISEFEWSKARQLKEDHGFMGRMAFPEDLDRPSRTVMATRSASTREAIIFGSFDENGKANGYRLPTIREISCFMSFPINYQFEGNNESVKYKLVGNAVCPKLSASLAEAILRKENLRVPEYIPLNTPKVRVNLNERKLEIKKPKPKKADAKFTAHVPGLKIKGFRIELTNKDSDFSKNNVKWNCYLHTGAGKNYKSYMIDNKVVEKVLKQHIDLESLKEKINKRFPHIINAKKLQESYCNFGVGYDLEPQKMLNTIKEIINPKLTDVKYIDITEFDIEKSVAPLQVIEGLFICNYLLQRIN